MAAASSQPKLAGPVASVHAWVKMPGLDVRTAQGQSQHALCKAAMGVSFAAGTTDGPGQFDFTQGSGNSFNPFWRFLAGFLHRASTEEKACHHPKAILLATGSIDFPYPWADDTVPIQLLRIGQLVIIGVPTEMTTMAGRRTRAAIKQRLVERGVLGAKEGVVVIAGLSNSYTDYTVTQEEYQAQRYEGGPTIYGPLQLDAYIQELERLADHLANGTTPASDPPPKDSSGHLIRTGGFKKGERAPADHSFGDVLSDAPATAKAGEAVVVTFVGGCLNNDLRTQDTYLRVERQSPLQRSPQLVAEDSDVETRIEAKEKSSLFGTHYEVSVCWDIPKGTPPGTYRIVHQGASWDVDFFAKDHAVPYWGASRWFSVTA